MGPGDWPHVAAIYAAGIATRNATFETEVRSYEDWDAGHLADHRFVAADGEQVVGWAALTGYSDRCCYAGVADLPSGQVLPGSAADFSAAATLTSLKLRTVKGAASFIDSAIAAATINNLTLGTIQTANGGTPFGVAAHAIFTATGTDAATGKAFRLRKPTAAMTAGDFTVRLV